MLLVKFQLLNQLPIVISFYILTYCSIENNYIFIKYSITLYSILFII